MNGPQKQHEPPDPSFELSGSTAAAIAAEKLASEHFGAWLDVELEKLVERWQHLAAPKASTPSGRFGRSRDRS